MTLDPNFIKDFIEELPDDDRADIKRIFALVESYADSLTIDDIREVAKVTSQSPILAYQLYEEYSREQQLGGQLLVCSNLTCLGKGAGIIIKDLEQRLEQLEQLGLNLELVKCLGACRMGPCIFHNGKMHTRMNIDSLKNFLANIS